MFEKAMKFPKNGFTLIELLVVIIMLGILIAMLLATFDPFAQLNKARDAQREHDLKQLNSALDTFYNDTNCYPTLDELPASGSIWPGSNSTVYMQKMPGDPSLASGWQNYAYVTDGSSCPQWNVVFAKISRSNTGVSSILCPLANMADCLPNNFNSANSLYNYCVLSGEVNCGTIRNLDASNPNSMTALGGGGGGGGSQNTPTPTLTPTPTPSGCPGDQYYVCAANGICNSQGEYQLCSNYPGGGGSLQCYCNSNCDGACR